MPQGGPVRENSRSAQKELLPALVAVALHGLDVALENVRCIRKCRHRAVDAAFAQQVQGRVGRAVGKIGDVVRCGASELVLRMQAGDLQIPLIAQVAEQGVDFAEKEIEVEKIGQ